MTALENLLRDVANLEALAHAAEQAAQRLPFTRDPELRRTIRHTQALICLIAELAQKALGERDQDAAGMSRRDRLPRNS